MKDAAFELKRSEQFILWSLRWVQQSHDAL
jgi:hypothetical protein